MSKTFKDQPVSKQNRRGTSRGRGRQRNISVRAVRRDPPDLRKLSRALVQLALAEAAAEASAENQTDHAAESGEAETTQAPPAGEPHD
jgi:hypothetical protein